MKSVLKRIMRKLPKRLVAATAIAVAVALPVASLSAAAVRIESSLGVANVTAGDTKYKESVNAKYDQVVKVQLYYHNKEDANSNKVAKNVRVKIAIPTAPGKSQVVNSTVSADNTNTSTDKVTVNLDRADAYLEYIPGSAVWKHNKGTNQNVQIVEQKISDNVVYGGQGVVVEDAKPCFNFDATITVMARVRVPGIKIDKTVRVKGSPTWATSNTAKPGETLEYKITYQNAGNSTHKNVVIRDSLPPSIKYVPGTTMLANKTNPTGVKYNSDNIVKGGIVIGTYGPGANGIVKFEAKLPEEKDLKCGVTEFRNVAGAMPQGMNLFYSTAVTKVEKKCVPTKPEVKKPVCKDFKLVKGEGREVNVSVSYKANGATLKTITYDFGDGSDLATNKTSVNHTYKKDGEYTVKTTARFMQDNKEVVVADEKCSGKVTFTTPETPEKPAKPAVKSQVTQLTKTGPAEVAGIFAVTSVVGAIAYNVVTRKLYR